MTDVLLRVTPDGGEIDVVGGQVTMDDGLQTAVYLSLFGGNDEDDGTQATERLQWWGNVSEQDPSRQYRSRTQAVLRGMPAIPANLKRVEDAAVRDLDWMMVDVAETLVVTATMPGRNRVRVRVDVGLKGGARRAFVFDEPWRTP